MFEVQNLVGLVLFQLSSQVSKIFLFGIRFYVHLLTRDLFKIDRVESISEHYSSA